MFLHTIDYTSHQRQIDLDILTDNSNLQIRNFAENAAIEQIKSHLRLRYDVDTDFYDITSWDNAITYNEDDHVVYNDETYYCIQSGTGQQPDTATTYWTKGDKRDKFLVMTAVDMAIYHLYAKIPQRTTPKDVEIRYSDALDWLKGVSKGDLVPNLTLLEDSDTTTTNRMKTGSQTKLNHRW